MEISKNRLCRTHFVSLKLWRETRHMYISHYQYFLTRIVPKSFKEVEAWSKPWRIHVQRAHMLHCEHYVLNSITNCFAIKTLGRANFQCVTGKSHDHLWNVYRDWFTDQPVKKWLNILIVVSDLLDNCLIFIINPTPLCTHSWLFAGIVFMTSTHVVFDTRQRQSGFFAHIHKALLVVWWD